MVEKDTLLLLLIAVTAWRILRILEKIMFDRDLGNTCPVSCFGEKNWVGAEC